MSEMECLNMDETPLEDWSKEDLIREMRRRENAFGKILDECDVTRRRGESSADALRRRLSPTAPQSEGVGYHIDGIGLGGNNYPIYDKTGIRVGNFQTASTENNKDEILDIMMASVNSHDRLTSLVQRLAELAREFIDDEVGCTARQYNEVNNSPCSTCPNRKLCQIIAEAGVPDETEGEKNES